MLSGDLNLKEFDMKLAAKRIHQLKERQKLFKSERVQFNQYMDKITERMDNEMREIVMSMRLNEDELHEVGDFVIFIKHGFHSNKFKTLDTVLIEKINKI